MKLHRALALLFFSSLLLGSHCSNERPLTPEEIKARNSAPQAEYPEMSLKEQEEVIARLDARRRQERDPKLRDNVPPADWIAVAYHGLLLDANFEVIPTDPVTIARMQESMYSILAGPASAKVRAKRGSDPIVAFQATQFDAQERTVIRGAVIDALLEESDPALRERYEWRHRLIRRRAALSTQNFGGRPQLRDLLQQFQLEDDSPTPPEEQPTYVEQCRADGVPIPPDWPDAKWISQGALSLVLISTTYSAEVFAYKDPMVPGVCYALPRRDKTSGSIELLGIICQSSTTGKACFWDNKNPDNTKITGTDIQLDIDSISNGMTLDENCTNCHRGDNAFIIHPGTALQLSRAAAVGGPYVTRTAVRYTPIGQTGWSNPAPLTLTPPPDDQSDCTSCHTLPETQPRNFYCVSVLWGAALETMPPTKPRAGWPPAVTPAYDHHITQLAACP